MKYQNIVVLTGAGISQESGLKTFRDADGLWEGHRVEEVATPEAFQLNPKLVYQFYNLRRAQLNLPEVKPNPAHLALAEFEKNHSGLFTLITQNVDNLHEQAGSKNVLHMHGEIMKARCLKTGKVFDWTDDFDETTPHPETNERGLLRPHIVWFGEVPFYLDEMAELIAKADLFVAIGTSGVVYPAAGLVQLTKPSCRRVLINLESTDHVSAFDEQILGKASKAVTRFFKDLNS